MNPNEKELMIAKLREKINQARVKKLSEINSTTNSTPKKGCGCSKKASKYKKFL